MDWQRQSMVKGGLIGLAAGLFAISTPGATTSLGDYVTLTNVIAHAATGDTVNLTNNITAGGEVDINSKGLTIEGNNYSISVPVPGLNASGVVNSSPSAFRVFSINATGVTNRLQDLTIMGGTPAGAGGGVWMQAGTLVLQSVTLSQSGGANYGGGGLDNSGGTVFMRDCNISRNAAEYGGGFLNSGTGAQLFLERCTFSENRSLSSSGGGGAGQNNNTLYANNCTFANNESTELGGAINNRPNAVADFVGCTFVGNVAYNPSFMGGAICNNGGYATLVNSLFAYNYHYNGASFDLNDLNNYTGAGASAPVAFYSVFHSTMTVLASSSIGNSLYTGNGSGSDNSLFCGGASALVLGPSGSPVGTATVFQPLLAKVGSSQTPTAVLMPGSFAVGKGARAAFSSAPATPVVGYYSGSSWVAVSGTNQANYEVTTDQNGTARGTALTVGAVNSTATGLCMLKVNAATNGTVSGGTIYGDNYPAGTIVTLTAIPAAGYAFSAWNYILGGTGVASTANPYAITLTTNVTLLPIFAAYTGFTITYADNGATGGTVPGQQVVAAGGNATISGSGTMVLSGYRFAAWNTRSDGNGMDYAPGTVYSGPTNLSLYARWSVIPAPTITAWPTNQNVSPGSPANLIITVTGSAPFGYQWFKDGGQLSGATNSSLAIASAGVTNSGVYYVAVSNAYGLALSLPVTVTVGTPQLMAWGFNGYGQLDDGSQVTKYLPEAVAANIVTASAGADHSLFVDGSGRLWAVGYNGDGELADGNELSVSNAVAVASNVVSAAAAVWHSLYIKGDGTLWVMGQDQYGQLGDGGTVCRTNAYCVASNVVAAAGGMDDSLFLKNNGTLWAMGCNSVGELGDGTTVSRSTAECVASNVVAIAAGANHSLYLDDAGVLWAMGENNFGQLGDGTTTTRSNAVAVAGNVAAIAAGGAHSLYVKNDGTLWAMGENSFGQLGDGTGLTRSNAVCVASNVVSVTAGEDHSLFLKNDGSLWAMGYNYYGCLGDGTTSTRLAPVPVTGMTLARIASSSYADHTLAVGLALGPTFASQPTNQTVAVGNNATFAVSVNGFAPLAYQWQCNGTNLPGATGSSFTCANALLANAGNYTVIVTNFYGSVTSSVAVLSVNKGTPNITTWPGASVIVYGQALSAAGLAGGGASPGGTFSFAAPATVPDAGTAAQAVVFSPSDSVDYVSVTNSVNVTVTPAVTTCTLVSSLNPSFAGGNVTFTVTVTAQAPCTAIPSGNVQFYTNAVAWGTPMALNSGVATASSAALAIGSTTVYGAYLRVTDFQPSTATLTQTVKPVPAGVTVTPNGNQTVAAGGSVNLNAAVTGTAPFSYQWYKDGAMLGGGTNSNLGIANAGVTNSGVYYVAVSNACGLALSVPVTVAVGTPQLMAWGNNSYGQLDDGSQAAKSWPEVVAGNVVTASAGADHSLFVDGTGTLWAVGYNGDGELGNGNELTTSNAVAVASNVVAAAGAAWHSLYVKGDGTLWAMGQNMWGELGDGTTVSRTKACCVATNVVATAGGMDDSLYLKTDGTVWAMGQNSYGELGDGTTVTRSNAVCVASNVVAIAAGELHSLFLKADGSLWTVGLNNSGQLGDGTTLNRSNAVPVATNVAAIAGGYVHSLYVKTDGTLWAMGDNSMGELGDGTITSHSTAVCVASNVAAITAGQSTSLFLKNDGSLWATGNNSAGEFGNGTTTSGAVPVLVPGMSVARILSGSAAVHSLAIGVPLAPSLVIQPANQMVAAGNNATFAVSVNGFAPLAYQWQRNGTNLPGAIASSYTCVGALVANSGNYTVIATNFYGSVTSSIAVLIVNPGTPNVTTWPVAAPIVYGQPLSASVLSGGAAAVGGTFSFAVPAADLNAGTSAQPVVFSPADTLDYNLVTNMVSVTVNPAATACFLTSSRNPSAVGANVTFTATVIAQALSQTTPVGSVQFFTNSVAWGGAVTLGSGMATVGSAGLPAGATVVSVVYPGGADYVPSTNTLTQVMAQPPSVVGINAPNGLVTVTFQGTAGGNYTVYATTNLAGPGSWVPVATNLVNSSGTWIYSKDATALPMQFYRAAIAQ